MGESLHPIGLGSDHLIILQVLAGVAKGNSSGLLRPLIGNENIGGKLRKCTRYTFMYIVPVVGYFNSQPLRLSMFFTTSSFLSLLLSIAWLTCEHNEVCKEFFVFEKASLHLLDCTLSWKISVNIKICMPHSHCAADQHANGSNIYCWLRCQEIFPTQPSLWSCSQPDREVYWTEDENQ